MPLPLYTYECYCSTNLTWSYYAGAQNDALFKELWHACAGPLVTVPREGERVYYFLQGHMEQVRKLLFLFFCFSYPYP